MNMMLTIVSQWNDGQKWEYNNVQKFGINTIIIIIYILCRFYSDIFMHTFIVLQNISI